MTKTSFLKAKSRSMTSFEMCLVPCILVHDEMIYFFRHDYVKAEMRVIRKKLPRPLIPVVRLARLSSTLQLSIHIQIAKCLHHSLGCN